MTSLDLCYEAGRILFSEWPTIVSVYVDALVKHYTQKWSLPDIMNTMGVKNETLLDLKQLRSQATLGLFSFASYGPQTAYQLVHGDSWN